MNLAQQIEELRRHLHAQRSHSDRILDAVFRQLHQHAEAVRNLEAAFGHLLEQPMPQQQREHVQEINRLNQQFQQAYRDPYQGGGYQ